MPTEKDAAQALGALLDGGLREYGIFREEGLVRIPNNLSFREGSTLPCAALTAWNVLYGGEPLRPGDTVLTLGTGGVSLFGVQFARVGGAEVISTTSSDDQAIVLWKLGARHVINYREDGEWGQTAKKLSNGGRGADYVLEIGGKLCFSSIQLFVIADEIRAKYPRAICSGSYNGWKHC